MKTRTVDQEQAPAPIEQDLLNVMRHMLSKGSGYDCYTLLTSGWIPNDQLVWFHQRIDDVYQYVYSLSGEKKIQALQQAIDPTHPLGQLFTGSTAYPRHHFFMLLAKEEQTLAYKKMDSLQRVCNTLVSAGFGWSSQFAFLCDKFMTDLIQANVAVEQTFDLLKTQNGKNDVLGFEIAAHASPATLAKYIHLLRALETHAEHPVSHQRLMTELVGLKKKDGSTFASVVAAGDNIAACVDLLEYDYLLPEDYAAFLPKKEAILDHILTKLDRAAKISALEHAMNEKHPLGKLFWMPRGLFKTNRNSGTLARIRTEHEKLLSTKERLAWQLKNLFVTAKDDGRQGEDMIQALKESQLPPQEIIDLLTAATTADGWTFGMQLAFFQQSDCNQSYIRLLSHLLATGANPMSIVTLLSSVYKQYTYGMMIANRLSPMVVQEYLDLLLNLKHAGLPSSAILGLLLVGGNHTVWRFGMLVAMHRAFSFRQLLSEYEWSDVSIQRYVGLLMTLLENTTLDQVMQLLNERSSKQAYLSAHILYYGATQTRVMFIRLLNKMLDLGVTAKTITALLKRGVFMVNIVGYDVDLYLKLLLRLAPHVPAHELTQLFTRPSSSTTYFDMCADRIVTADLFELANRGIIPLDDAQYFANRKEEILTHIMKIPSLEHRRDALRNAKNKSHPLGRIFWTQRGALSPREHRGSLKQINAALAQLDKILLPAPPSYLSHEQPVYSAVPALPPGYQYYLVPTTTPHAPPLLPPPIPAIKTAELPVKAIQPAKTNFFAEPATTTKNTPIELKEFKKPVPVANGLSFFPSRRETDLIFSSNANQYGLPKALEPTPAAPLCKKPVATKPVAAPPLSLPSVPTTEPRVDVVEDKHRSAVACL